MLVMTDLDKEILKYQNKTTFKTCLSLEQLNTIIELSEKRMGAKHEL